jgi:hypothetical protein
MTIRHRQFNLKSKITYNQINLKLLIWFNLTKNLRTKQNLRLLLMHLISRMLWLQFSLNIRKLMDLLQKL